MDIQEKNFEITEGAINFMKTNEQMPLRVRVIELISIKTFPESYSNYILIESRVEDGQQNEIFYFITVKEWDKAKLEKEKPIVEIKHFKKINNYILIGSFQFQNLNKILKEGEEEPVIDQQIQRQISIQQDTLEETVLKLNNQQKPDKIVIQGMVLELHLSKDRRNRDYYWFYIQDGTQKVLVMLFHQYLNKIEELQPYTEYIFQDVSWSESKFLITHTTIIIDVKAAGEKSRIKFLNGEQINKTTNQPINIMGRICYVGGIGLKDQQRLVVILDENQQQIQVILTGHAIQKQFDEKKQQKIVFYNLRIGFNQIIDTLQLVFQKESFLDENTNFQIKEMPTEELKYYKKQQIQNFSEISDQLKQVENGGRICCHFLIQFYHFMNQIEKLTKQTCLIALQNAPIHQAFDLNNEKVAKTILGLSIEEFLSKSLEEKKQICQSIRGQYFDAIIVAWLKDNRVYCEILDVKDIEEPQKQKKINK